MKRKLKDGKDANLQRQNIMMEAAKKVSDSVLSEWSFIRHGKIEDKDSFFEEPLRISKKEKILKNYGIQPTLVSLSGSIINGEQLFKSSELMKIENIKEREKVKKELYVGHKQMIDIGSTPDDFKYEYRIAIYPAGFIDTDNKRKFMGLDYISKLGTNNSEIPYLDIGEVMSDPIYEGSQISNRKIVNKPFNLLNYLHQHQIFL